MKRTFAILFTVLSMAPLHADNPEESPAAGQKRLTLNAPMDPDISPYTGYTRARPLYRYFGRYGIRVPQGNLPDAEVGSTRIYRKGGAFPRLWRTRFRISKPGLTPASC